MSLPPHSSTWCSQPCWRMPSTMSKKKNHSGIYMETYTTCVGYRYNWSRPTKLQCVTSCSQMTVRLTLPPKPISNWASIVFLLLAITLGGTISAKETDVLHQSATQTTRVVYQPTLSKRKFPRQLKEVDVPSQYTFQICPNGRRGQFTHCQVQLSLRTT